MKKTIALLLALITMLSVALISCDKDDENNDAGLDDGLVATNPGGNNTNNGNEENNGGDEGEDEPQYDDSSFSEKTGKAYAVWNVNKRVEPSTKATSLGVVNKFAEIDLLEVSSDGKWYKAKVGDDTCYVAAKYFETNAGIMKYTNYEESDVKTVYIDVEKTMNLRVTPNWDIDENIGGIIERDTAVKQVGISESGTIAKIEYDGKTYYMNVKYLSDDPVGEFDPEKDNGGDESTAG